MVTRCQVVGVLPMLILLLLSAKTCAGAKDPPCPFDMKAVLPTAEYSGPLLCSKGSSSTGTPSCLDVKDKVALIIGASTGLGRGSADRLAAAGMKVIGTSRTPEQHNGSCTYTKPGDRCKPAGWQLWKVDQTSQESVDALIQRVKKAYGRIDLLYLNAGRGWGSNVFKPNGKTWCNDIDQMKLVMETNFWGPVRVLIAALPLIPKEGYARILVTASLAAWVGSQGALPYTASKAALSTMGEEWLYEFYGSRAGNVKFTTIYPGGMMTDIARNTITACKTQSAGFHKEWPQWEQGQYYQPTSQYITPSQGGEAIYRLAISPNPLQRYMLNFKKGEGYMRKRICTHLANPMDVWPKGFDS